MKINGIGQVKKDEIASILTTEGREAWKAGEITDWEVAMAYKIEMVKRETELRKYPDTFSNNWDRIPEGLREKLSPKELAELVEAFYKCFRSGENEKTGD